MVVKYRKKKKNRVEESGASRVSVHMCVCG